MYNNMADATLLYQVKKIYPDGAVKEMVIWQLPERDKERPHGLKYRLYYGMADGTCMVRYDNETGKGDHRHFLDQEKVYRFKDVESLVNDFQHDIDLIREKNDE
jgi:hypothetical protein